MKTEWHLTFLKNPGMNQGIILLPCITIEKSHRGWEIMYGFLFIYAITKFY